MIRPVALITGGARRVGRATALALARRGCDVVISFASSREAAEQTAAEARALGVGAHTLALDLAAPLDAARLTAEILRLDILVHNASTYESSRLDGLDIEAAERQLRVNALGPLALSAALAPFLAESGLPGGGAIVAMLDIHAEGLPRPHHAAYAMSKAALGAMVRSLARDLAPKVRVNGVAPGVVAWPETGPEANPELQRRYLDHVPLARAGTPDEAAAAVTYLALDATYTTGQTLRVDGGRSLL